MLNCFQEYFCSFQEIVNISCCLGAADFRFTTKAILEWRDVWLIVKGIHAVSEHIILKTVNTRTFLRNLLAMLFLFFQSRNLYFALEEK